VSVKLKSKIRFNGKKHSGPDELPPSDRDDVMSVIENNGEVTIPKAEPLLTKKEVAIVAGLGAGILTLVLARMANG
jgi:hypothetical protein